MILPVRVLFFWVQMDVTALSSPSPVPAEASVSRVLPRHPPPASQPARGASPRLSPGCGQRERPPGLALAVWTLLGFSWPLPLFSGSGMSLGVRRVVCDGSCQDQMK